MNWYNLKKLSQPDGVEVSVFNLLIAHNFCGRYGFDLKGGLLSPR